MYFVAVIEIAVADEGVPLTVMPGSSSAVMGMSKAAVESCGANQTWYWRRSRPSTVT